MNVQELVERDDTIVKGAVLTQDGHILVFDEETCDIAESLFERLKTEIQEADSEASDL